MENSSEIGYKPSLKSRLVDEVGNKVFKQLKRENDLYPCECGGRMMHQITFLHLGFDYYKQIDIEKARELLMSAGNLFLKTINEDERIHPFLDSYPFLPKNIEILIFLREPKGSKFGPRRLYVISMSEGVLKYYINDPETNHLLSIYNETYEEAEEKLGIPVRFVHSK